MFWDSEGTLFGAAGGWKKKFKKVGPLKTLESNITMRICHDWRNWVNSWVYDLGHCWKRTYMDITTRDKHEKSKKLFSYRINKKFKNECIWDDGFVAQAIVWKKTKII